MNTFLIIIISILIIFIIWLSNKESFANIDYTLAQAYRSDQDTTKPVYIDELSMRPVTNINCCLVEKKYSPVTNNMFGGQFGYTFTKLSGGQCDSKLYNLNSNKQLLIDGENNWSNKDCGIGTSTIGSCRNMNKECIDFVDKPLCDKYKMVWSKRTCAQPLDYVWVDRINLILPKLPTTDTLILFNTKLKPNRIPSETANKSGKASGITKLLDNVNTGLKNIDTGVTNMVDSSKKNIDTSVKKIDTSVKNINTSVKKIDTGVKNTASAAKNVIKKIKI